MKINWKIRFKNKIWLSTFISACIAIIYTILDYFGIVPEVSEFSITRIIEAFLMILSLTGVIIDPTTAGLDDSIRAQHYEEPWDDTHKEGGNG